MYFPLVFESDSYNQPIRIEISELEYIPFVFSLNALLLKTKLIDGVLEGRKQVENDFVSINTNNRFYASLNSSHYCVLL